MNLPADFQLDTALAEYHQAWAIYVAEHPSAVFETAKATTLSLKLADKASLFKILKDNIAEIEQVHIGTVNERYIASAALFHDFAGLPILKLLERRPGSDDPLGLD